MPRSSFTCLSRATSFSRALSASTIRTSLSESCSRSWRIRGSFASLVLISEVYHHGRAVVVHTEEGRGEPHRDADATVRRGVGRYGWIAVDREAAREVQRIPEHPVPAADLAVDPPGADGSIAGRAGTD